VLCLHDLAVHFCRASIIDALRFVVLYVVLYVDDFAVLYVDDFAVHFGYTSILDAFV
jgi:hypothetical protein